MWFNVSSYGKLAIVTGILALVVALYFGANAALDSYVDSQLDNQANEASRQAVEGEENRVKEQTQASLEEVKLVLHEIEKTRLATEVLNEQLKADWEAKLKENPLQWINDTNSDTSDQLRRGQEAIYHIRSTASDM